MPSPPAQNVTVFVSNLPVGAIIMFSGSATNLPPDWRVCDGTNGTPDLRGRFVIGVGPSYAFRSTGGQAKVTLTIDEMPAHAHSGLGMPWGAPSNGDTPDLKPGTADTDTTGGGEPHENLPPYYALYYIMKVQ